jgi:adenylate cyclase
MSLALVGESARAREWVQRALLLDPDNLNMRYNVACTLIYLGDSDEALDTLDPWFKTVTSATRIRHSEADPDLDSIRGDPRFKEMLASAKERLGVSDG